MIERDRVDRGGTEASGYLSRTNYLRNNDNFALRDSGTENLQVLGSRARTHAHTRARSGGTETSVPSVPSVPEELETLADQVRHLAPDRHNPEAFHEAKSEIAAALRRLARAAARE